MPALEKERPPQLNAPSYIFIGLEPNEQIEQTAIIKQHMPVWRQTEKGKYRPAELTINERKKLAEVEGVSRAYLKRKISSYLLDATYIDNIEIDYLSDLKPKGAEGFHNGMYNLTAAVVQTPISETVGAIAHELSHASTRHLLVVIRAEHESSSKIIDPIGFGQYNSEKNDKDAIGLENMLAIWDEVDIIREVKNADIFSSEENYRHILRLSPKVRDISFNDINNSWFGPISHDELNPFIGFKGENIRLHGVQVLNAPSYLLIRELCRVVGFDMYRHDLSLANLTTEQIIQAGRAKLDKCRYTGSLEGRETLERLFGKEGLDLLLGLSDRKLEGFDDAMKMIREKQLEQGSLPVIPMKWQPLNWKTSLDA